MVFNIISHQSTFDINSFNNGGWTGLMADNKYIDNRPGTALSSASFSIKTTSNLFKVNRFWVYITNQSDVLGSTGTLTITGKLSGVAKYTQTKPLDLRHL